MCSVYLIEGGHGTFIRSPSSVWELCHVWGTLSALYSYYAFWDLSCSTYCRHHQCWKLVSNCKALISWYTDHCNIRMDPAIWAQATLPASKGGLGVRCSVDLAIPAFLSSSYTTADLVFSIFPSREHGCYPFVTEALGIWERQLGSSPSPEDARGQQHIWHEACIDQKLDHLLKSAPGPPKIFVS